MDFTQCVNDDGVRCCVHIHLLKIYSARTSSREKRGGKSKSGIFTLYRAYQQLPHASPPHFLLFCFVSMNSCFSAMENSVRGGQSLLTL